MGKTNRIGLVMALLETGAKLSKMEGGIFKVENVFSAEDKEGEFVFGRSPEVKVYPANYGYRIARETGQTVPERSKNPIYLFAY